MSNGGQGGYGVFSSLIGWLVGGFLALLALGLVIGSCWLIVWNEGRALRIARAFDEAALKAQPISGDTRDPTLDGKLVLVSGQATSAAGLSDPRTGLRAPALKLVRAVEMYQWRETEKGKSDDRRKVYSREWTANALDSQHFENRSGHENPPFPISSETFAAPDARIGAVPVGSAAAATLDGERERPVDEAEARKAGEALGLPIRVAGGGLYAGRDPDSPHVGDLRIHYRVVSAGPATFLGIQGADGLSPYQATNGFDVLIGRTGLHDAPGLAAAGIRADSGTSWGYRALAMFGMFFGFMLLVSLFAGVAGMRIGSGLGAAIVASGFALVATLIVGPTTILATWLAHRPLAAAGVVAAGATVVALLVVLRRRRRPRALVSAPVA